MKDLLRANWDRVLAVVFVVAGLVMLLVGWFGVSGTGLVAKQNPYLISAGLGGIAVLAIGCTIWLSADLQDEWRRLDSIEERLEALAPATEEPAVPPRRQPARAASLGSKTATRATRSAPAARS